MADTHDLVVLGGGTGGYATALHAATLGLRVALVERDKVGGTCLHRGCIPTKALLQAAEVAEHARDASHYGVTASFQGVDGEQLVDYQQQIVQANHKGLEQTLGKRGVDVVAGTGRLEGPAQVVVATDDGERRLQAERGVVLATGSRPSVPPIEGLEVDGERVVTSDEALFLTDLPERPIVLGASAVGAEMASCWAGFGAEQVELVELLDRVVPMEDADSSRALQRAWRRGPISVRTGAKATSVERGDDGVRVGLDDGTTLEGDLLLVATGREPVTSGMGFEEVGVPLDDAGRIPADGLGRTGVDGVWAVGDVLAPPALALAHASFQEGITVAEQAAGRSPLPIDYRTVPRVYYTHPEVASVGMTEAEAREAGHEVRTQAFPFTHNARAMMMRGQGQVKLVAAEDGPVLGVHVVGPKATDLIAEAQLIYAWEALPTEVADLVHAHPTLSEAVGEAHMALVGRPLHG